jgi:hypothetical protein
VVGGRNVEWKLVSVRCRECCLEEDRGRHPRAVGETHPSAPVIHPSSPENRASSRVRNGGADQLHFGSGLNRIGEVGDNCEVMGSMMLMGVLI